MSLNRFGKVAGAVFLVPTAENAARYNPKDYKMI